MSNKQLAIDIIDVLRQKSLYKEASKDDSKDLYFAEKIAEIVDSSESDFPKAAFIAYEIVSDTKPKVDVVDFFNKIAAAELIINTLKDKEISKTAEEVRDITKLYLCNLFEELLRG